MADKLTIQPLPNQDDGVIIAADITTKAGFHGAAVAQRAGADQAAVTAAAIAVAAGANPTKAEYDTAVARINALTTLVNELRAALVAKGLIKGAA